jgi:hypothetical protein
MKLQSICIKKLPKKKIWVFRYTFTHTAGNVKYLETLKKVVDEVTKYLYQKASGQENLDLQICIYAYCR